MVHIHIDIIIKKEPFRRELGNLIITKDPPCAHVYISEVSVYNPALCSLVDIPTVKYSLKLQAGLYYQPLDTFVIIDPHTDILIRYKFDRTDYSWKLRSNKSNDLKFLPGVPYFLYDNWKTGIERNKFY